jgi:hypothetical protein
MPDGLCGLNSSDSERIRKANLLYRFTAGAAKLLSAKKRSWAIENPSNSLMWKTSWFKELLKDDAVGAKMVTMQMCMHGGKRNKRTTLAYAGKVDLSSMGLTCDGSHEHAPWGTTRDDSGTFATAEERNYPAEFCKKVAAQAALDLKITKPKVKIARQGRDDDKGKEWAGIQPRRDKRDLVPEYKEIRTFRGATAKHISNLEKKEDHTGTETCGDLVYYNKSTLLDVESDEGVSGSWSGTLGTCWTKEEFVEQARGLIHPFDRQVRVPQRVAKVIFDAATKGPKWVEKQQRTLLCGTEA